MSTKKEMDKIIGSNVKRISKEKKITQAELADALNLSISTISKIEQGSRSLTTENAIRIAEFLNVDVDSFYAIPQEPNGEWDVVSKALTPKNLQLLRHYIEGNYFIEFIGWVGIKIGNVDSDAPYQQNVEERFKFAEGRDFSDIFNSKDVQFVAGDIATFTQPNYHLPVNVIPQYIICRTLQPGDRSFWIKPRKTEIEEFFISIAELEIVMRTMESILKPLFSGETRPTLEYPWGMALGTEYRVYSNKVDSVINKYHELIDEGYRYWFRYRSQDKMASHKTETGKPRARTRTCDHNNQPD